MKNNHKIFDYGLLLLGSISITYFFILLVTISFSLFLLIYPMFSFIAIGLASYELKTHMCVLSIFSKWIQVIVLTFVSVVVLFFFYTEGKIIHQSFNSHQGPSDFIVVLGAQVRGTSLSPSLQYRLDAALEYYQMYPTTIVVSGGQGPGEDVSEAKAMKQYLIQNGIPEKYILVEEKSTSTYENLVYTKDILDTYQSEYTITIITNGFHCYRALYIANSLGYTAFTYAAKEYAISTPHYYIREFFAYVSESIL